MISHSKTDYSLGRVNNSLTSVNLVLYYKTVMRTDFIEKKDQLFSFSSYVYNRSWSKGHAKFWGIDEEDVHWNELGEIKLYVNLENYGMPIILPLETNKFDIMINDKTITPLGRLKIGLDNGQIFNVNYLSRNLSYSDFYSFYIKEKQKITVFARKFKEIMKGGNQYKLIPIENNYKYLDNSSYLLETGKAKNKIMKEHGEYKLGFFTEQSPGIAIAQEFLISPYKAIFESENMKFCHVGEKFNSESINIGNLRIFNEINISKEDQGILSNLLESIHDIEIKSRKATHLMQLLFCLISYKKIKNRHLKYLFKEIENKLLYPEIAQDFKDSNVIIQPEKMIEFKSADEVQASSRNFVEEHLVPTVMKYISNGKLERTCIIYGVEDNGKINPLNRLKSDQITNSETLANNILLKEKIKIEMRSIPVNEKYLLAVFLLSNN